MSLSCVLPNVFNNVQTQRNLHLFQSNLKLHNKNPTFSFSLQRNYISYFSFGPMCSDFSYFFIRGCCMTVLCWFSPQKVFVIYTCSTISGASIFYLEHLFFIRRECCVTQRYCCFGSVEVFGENITLDPFTCIWLAEGLGWGNRLIFIFGLSCGALFPSCEFKI